MHIERKFASAKEVVDDLKRVIRLKPEAFINKDGSPMKPRQAATLILDRHHVRETEKPAFMDMLAKHYKNWRQRSKA